MNWRRNSTRRRLIFVLAVGWASAPTYGQTAKLYWIDNAESIDRRGVWRANLDGTDQEQLTALVLAQHSVAMAIDRPRAKIYWSAVNGVLRADLDGSNVEEVPFPAFPGGVPCALAIDSLNRKLYWVGSDSPDFGPDLWRATLDGSALERLPNAPNICFLAMDQVMRRVYFWGAQASGEGGGILSANLDDPGFTPSPAAAFPSVSQARSLALDTLDRRVYWIESGRSGSRGSRTIGRILRAGVDGGNTEIVVGDTFGGIISITIAPTRGLLFWTQTDGIHRSALDGSTPTQIVARDVHGIITGLAVWTPPGDFDRDGDVDLADLMTLQSCVTGPGEPLADDPACHEADLDFDRDVDLADLVAFQAHFTGAR